MTGDGPADRPFTPVQKEYLAGFAAGLATRGLLPAAGRAAAPPNTPAAEPSVHGTPFDELSREERLKVEENPLDIWEKIVRHADADRPPEGGDVFRFKFHGLFHVAPAQDAFMARLRLPAGEVSAPQLRGLARIARERGGGYADITTRASLQIREIAPRDSVRLLLELAELGISLRGSGADNIRNITATPTAGFDPDEILDVRPLARALQFHIANCRDLYGLPRKFNIAFDGGGAVGVAADTNDIGFVACRVTRPEAGLEPGGYFRVLLGGVTGHGRFADDCGLLLRPEECVPVAAAMVRVFAETGDRTDRRKARLCYVLDRIGVDGFLERTRAKFDFPLRKVPAAACEPAPPRPAAGHLGIRPQRQPDLHSLGVAVPVGRLSAAQMEALAGLAEHCGSGALRLTVWQNLIVPDVPAHRLDEAQRRLADAGLGTALPNVSAGLVACTGNSGCRFAATDTKGQALALGRALAGAVELDRPLGIHLTGCPHSCAQHRIGDIGLLGAKVDAADGAVDGYHVYVGGGCDGGQGLGRELAQSVPVAALAPLLIRLLTAYRELRADGEAFADFARRHETAALRAMAGLAA